MNVNPQGSTHLCLCAQKYKLTELYAKATSLYRKPEGQEVRSDAVLSLTVLISTLEALPDSRILLMPHLSLPREMFPCSQKN